VKWHQGESNDEPPVQDDTLIPHVGTLATRKDSPRVTSLGDCGQDERTEVSTTFELILDRQTTGGTNVLGPLLVDLSLQIERALLVRNVAGSNEEGETDPQQEGVPGEETTIVEEDSGPADQ